MNTKYFCLSLFIIFIIFAIVIKFMFDYFTKRLDDLSIIINKKLLDDNEIDDDIKKNITNTKNNNVNYDNDEQTNMNQESEFNNESEYYANLLDEK